MDFELECMSPMGARFAELAEKHATEFALAAQRRDREGRFPVESWVEMHRSGLLSAAIPQELGGLGVAAVHDLVVAISRLARGDGSVAIGTAMHTTALWNFARVAQDNAGRSLGDHLRFLLRACARRQAVVCVALSERGTALGRPDTTATADTDGYLVNGTKMFCTNSPGASLFLSTLRIRTRDGESDRLGFAIIPRETPGVRVSDNWDALGMRASGSGEVAFENCRLPARMVTGAGPLGVLPMELFPLVMAGALVLAGAFLGIAEQACGLALDVISRRSDAARPVVRALVAENEIDLATSRAILSRTARRLDQLLAQPAANTDRAATHGVMRA